MNTQKGCSVILFMLLLAVQYMPVSTAQNSPLSGKVTTTSKVNTAPKVIVKPVYRTKTVYVRDERTYFQRHPKVKAVTVGAGVGTAAGAATGLISGRGVVRGAAIGAGTGAGVGLVRSSRTMKRHPIARNVSTGTLVGLGLGAAASRNPNRKWQGAGVGAALGLGASLLKGDLQ